MPHVRIDHLLAGTALAVGMALFSPGQNAFAQTAKQIEAAIPVPVPADVQPLTPADVAPKAQAAAAAPSAPANISAADAAIGEKLRELTAGKFDRIIGNKKERAAIEAFYSGRNFAPLWIANGAANERAKAATAYLAGVERDGLDPSEYPRPEFAGSEPDALAEAELKLTSSVLTFARHAQIGRVHYTRIAGDISYNLTAPEGAEVLAKMAASKNIADALDGYNPQQPGYKALKAALVEARKGPVKADEVVRVPEGPTLKSGMSDPRVVILRKRLKVEGDESNPLYDDAVLAAVKNFQKSEGLGTDGAIGPGTLRALNKSQKVAADPVDTIVANLERWRWIPRDLGNIYVMVNIPDYTLSVIKDGALYWKTRIVVGKQHLATPLISAEMKFITVNPTWNVPPSIIEKEYLPALQEDPQAMERIGLKVEQAADGTVRIFQPPGDRNALGRIRFNFPNKFLVYQHDTPDKHLFAHDKRAYSHGCMRVQDPLKYGEVILSLALPSEGYTQERLRKMFGGSEININFPSSIPVHLTYQTAFVEDGKLQLREDIYTKDARMLAILKGSERKVADIPIERANGSSGKPVRLPPGSFGGGYRGPNLFDLLFGGKPPAPQPARRATNNGRVSFR